MADPMSDERLAEIQEEIDLGTGLLSDVTGAELLAEVKQLRAALAEEREEREHRIHTADTDVTWLADGVRRIIEGVSVRTANDPGHAQAIIAQEAVSLINAGILTDFVSSRVVDLAVEHIREAQAERDRARAVAAAAEATLGEQIDRAIKAEAERDEAWTTITELRAQTVALGKATEQVEHTRALLPEINATFGCLCVQLDIESQEALAEIYSALKHNLGAVDGGEVPR